jgi:hypothetical protein
MDANEHSSLRAALQPEALRAALSPGRPVFADPWDSTTDMFICFVAVSVVDPWLLWAGGKLMGSIFDFSSHWRLGVYMVAALVGAAGIMTIVGRRRTSLSVDLIVIATWVVLGLIVAPVLGLALSPVPALICYGVLLVANFGYVLLFGRWEKAFLLTLSWPLIWSAMALLFAYAAYRSLFYPYP